MLIALHFSQKGQLANFAHVILRFSESTERVKRVIRGKRRDRR